MIPARSEVACEEAVITIADEAESAVRVKIELPAAATVSAWLWMLEKMPRLAETVPAAIVVAEIEAAPGTGVVIVTDGAVPPVRPLTASATVGTSIPA